MRLKKYIVTVDIGGTKTNIGYFYNGKLEKIKKYPTDKFGPNNIRMITDILVNSKIHILAICLSLTGLIDKKGLWSPINKKTLGDFKNFPVNNYDIIIDCSDNIETKYNANLSAHKHKNHQV